MALDVLINPSNLERDYGRLIRNILLRRTNDLEVVEDLTQDVYFRALQNLHQYEPERAKIGTWLSKIAINVQNDYFRGRMNESLVELDVGSIDIRVHPQAIVGCSIGPEEYLLRKEKVRIVRRAIDTLPDIHRKAIMLRYYHNLTGEEIGDAINLSSARVYVILKEAENKLKRKLKEYQ